MRKEQNMHFLCENKEIQEQVVRAYIQKAKGSSTPAAIRCQNCIDSEVRINGFRSASKAPEAKLYPELLHHVRSRKRIHFYMALAWIETNPEIYKQICVSMHNLNLEDKLKEATSEYLSSESDDAWRSKIDEIMDDVSNNLEMPLETDKKGIFGIALYKRGCELLSLEENEDNIEIECNNEESSIKSLCMELLKIAGEINVEDPDFPELRRCAEDILSKLNTKEKQSKENASLDLEITQFYIDFEDGLGYLIKKIKNFPVQKKILESPAEVKRRCIEILHTLAPKIEQAMNLRGEVADDPEAVDKLMETIAEIEEMKSTLESLLSSIPSESQAVSSNSVDDNAVETQMEEPDVVKTENVIEVPDTPLQEKNEEPTDEADLLVKQVSERASELVEVPETNVEMEEQLPALKIDQAEKKTPSPSTEKVSINTSPAPAILENSRDIARKAVSSSEWNQALSDLTWALIAEGRFREAHHVRRILSNSPYNYSTLPDPRLIEGIYLSRETLGGSASSRFAERLESVLDSYTIDYLNKVSISDPAQSLLALSACLRPTFIADGLNGVSTGLLREAIREIDGRLLALRQLSLDIAEFADKHYPFDLVAARGRKFWDTALEDVRAEAREWLERAPHRKMIYTQAFILWKEWTGKSGRLSTPLGIVEADDYSSLQKVKSLIDSFPTEEAVKHEVQKHQSIQKQPDIKSNALRHLCEHTMSGVRIARKWVSLKESIESRKDSFKVKRSEEMLSRLKEVSPPAIAEIEAYSANSIEEAASAKACGIILSSILNLINPGDGQELKEPDFDWYTNEISFHLPGVEIAEKGSQNFDTIAKELFQTFADDDWSIGHAFNTKLKVLDFRSVETILEHVRAKDGESKELLDFEQQRVAKLQESGEILRKKLQAVQAQVEEAVSNNVLKETERLDFVGRIDSIVDLSEKSKLSDYRNAFSQLDIIAENVKGLVDRRRDEIMVKIADIGQVDDATRNRLKDLAVSNDFVTVEDYIGKIKSGEPLPSLDFDPTDPATRFLNKAESIEADFKDPATGRERINYIGWFAQRIKDRKQIPSLNIEKVTGASTTRFANALDEWAEIRRIRTCSVAQIEKILKVMGFLAIKKLEKVDTQPNLGWLRLTTETISDREQCQSPVFGSLANGCYRILCIYERYEVSQIVNLVGDTSNKDPLIVLLFTRLALPRRRDLAAICVEKRRSFIVVDDLLLLSLADSENPLRSMFSSALPFSFAEPYMPTSSIVPREMFFGRKYELESIIDPRGSCFIYGGRQLGKTVLLREAGRRAHNESSGKIAVWIDLKNHRIGYDRALEELWSVIGAELSKYGIIPQKDTQNLRPEKLKHRIMEWLDADNKRSILVLLDEADMFLEKDGRPESEGKGYFVYSSVLKGLMDSSMRRIKIVFAGLHNVQRMTKLPNHPLAHLGQPLCIGPLIDRNEGKEAEALIRAPLESVGYTISQDLVYRILALTNYYPSLIQLFCQELLKHLGSRVKELFNPRDTPPRVISSRHVEEAYRSENLRKAIRDRFYWTLQLDQRYEVIAYAMAYEYLSDPTADPPLEMNVAHIRDRSISWWKDGFATNSHEEIRALLDEMVGLGILRLANGKYAFRNSNILRLLGTQDEIADLLVQDRNPPLEFAPVHMRDIRLENGKFAISPFTTSQEASLRKPSDDTRVVILPPMVSSTSLNGFLEKMFGNKILWGLDNLFAADITEFGKRLKKKFSGAEVGTYAVVYESSEPWTARHIREAMSIVKKKSTTASSFHVLFVADSQHAWQLLQDDHALYNELLESGDHIMCLGKMHEQSLRYWLEEQPDYSLSRNKDHQTQLMGKTSGWPVLVEYFHKIFIDCGRNFDRAIQIFEEGFSDSGHLPVRIEDIIISSNDLRANTLSMLRENAKFDEFSETELIKALGSANKSEVASALEWAKSLGYISKVGDKEWSIDPFVGRLLDIK